MRICFHFSNQHKTSQTAEQITCVVLSILKVCCIRHDMMYSLEIK